MPIPSLREFVLVRNTMKASADMSPLDLKTQPQEGKITSEKEVEGSANDEYFTSYNDVEIHRLMLYDKPRTGAYQEAIMANKHLFKGKVVMDVGAGTGILSLFAMRAGARRVYAVEASPLARVLREIVDLNDQAGVIQVVHGKAEDISLPQCEKVDIIISEWMGFYLLHESMLDSVIAARDRHLQEDGLMFPSHATVLAAPVQLDNWYQERVNSWGDVYGFDMTPMAQESVQARLAGGQPEVMSVDSSSLLADPVAVAELDLRWVSREEVRMVEDRKFVSVTRPGNFHGLALWFSVRFHPVVYEGEYEEEIVPVTLSTGPADPPTHWKQTVIVLPGAQGELELDEVVGWNIVMKQAEENCRRYNIDLSVLDPAEDEHPMPCGCKMAKCELYAALLQKEEDDFEEMSVDHSLTS